MAQKNDPIEQMFLDGVKDASLEAAKRVIGEIRDARQRLDAAEETVNINVDQSMELARGFYEKNPTASEMREYIQDISNKDDYSSLLFGVPTVPPVGHEQDTDDAIQTRGTGELADIPVVESDEPFNMEYLDKHAPEILDANEGKISGRIVNKYRPDITQRTAATVLSKWAKRNGLKMAPESMIRNKTFIGMPEVTIEYISDVVGELRKSGRQEFTMDDVYPFSNRAGRMTAGKILGKHAEELGVERIYISAGKKRPSRYKLVDDDKNSGLITYETFSTAVVEVLSHSRDLTAKAVLEKIYGDADYDEETVKTVDEMLATYATTEAKLGKRRGGKPAYFIRRENKPISIDDMPLNVALWDSMIEEGAVDVDEFSIKHIDVFGRKGMKGVLTAYIKNNAEVNKWLVVYKDGSDSPGLVGPDIKVEGISERYFERVMDYREGGSFTGEDVDPVNPRLVDIYMQSIVEDNGTVAENIGVRVTKTNGMRSYMFAKDTAPLSDGPIVDRELFVDKYSGVHNNAKDARLASER